MLRQRLAQKLQQKLSPQQIQLMKLLQIPTANLEQRIEEELEANPALEEGDAIDNVLDELDDEMEERGKDEDVETESLEEYGVEDYFDDEGDYPDYKTSDGYANSGGDSEHTDIPFSVGVTFHEFLLKQLGIKELDDESYLIGSQIIGSIGDDGYLRRELINIVDDLAFAQNITTTEEEVEEMLELVQTFDPPGVGARDLQECLLLQLDRKDSNPLIRKAQVMIKNYFDQFAKKHYSKLENALDLGSDELKSVIDEVLKLNPKPGSSYSESQGSAKVNRYIIPDFTIKNNEGELELLLNMRNAPDLKVSKSFKDMYEGYKASKEKSTDQKNAILFIKQKMDAAKWFIDAIRQRQQTMMLTMRTILDYQINFFLTGDETQLRPMILKDIANETGLDISTVSRVANSKYVQTEFGIYLLKYFFSESMQNEDGDEVSTREIKAILQEVIGAENKKKPLSDQKLMEKLKDKGYIIARRTVAKYREQLNIPVARLRKEL
ncbi:MAG: RNA polymerase factor sigma-54 [Chitinophagales bacterium]|nr:RNA polymerase factor sigma-54 [Chitinophagales bacterium]